MFKSSILKWMHKQLFYFIFTYNKNMIHTLKLIKKFSYPHYGTVIWLKCDPDLFYKHSSKILCFFQCSIHGHVIRESSYNRTILSKLHLLQNTLLVKSIISIFQVILDGCFCWWSPSSIFFSEVFLQLFCYSL